MADNRIFNITEDKHGFMWMGTTPRLYSCYDLQRACFVEYIDAEEPEQNYSKLFLASNGDVWLWHPDNGARRVVHQADGKLTSVAFKTESGNLPDNRVNFVQEDATGRIWIGTKRGLAIVVNGETKIIDRVQHFVSATIHQDDDYLLTEDGSVFCYQKMTNLLKKQVALSSVAEKTTLTGHFRMKDKWVFLTTTGVYNYHLKTGKLSSDSNLHIKNGEVFRDNKGDFWVYNRTGVVHYIRATTEETKVFRLIPEDKLNHIDFERYHVVHDSRGIIWISTYGNGLFAYNTTNDTLEHFAAGMTENSYINSDFLLYVMEDRAGGIWVSSEYSGISHITVLNEGTTRIYPENPALFDRSNAIRTIAEMSNGDITITTRKGGLFTYDASFKQKTNQSYFHSNIYTLQKDATGKLWMGSRGEGLKIGTDWYCHNKLDISSLSNNNIFAIHQDVKGRMWIGTFGGGLDLAEPTKDGKYKFRHFFQGKYGTEMVRVFQEDKNGMIWMGTSEGICIFNPDSLIADPQNYH